MTWPIAPWSIVFLLLHQDLSLVLTIYVTKEMRLNFASSGPGTGPSEGSRTEWRQLQGQSDTTLFPLLEFFYAESKIRTDLSSFVSLTPLICFSRAEYPRLYLCGISSKMKRKQHSFWVDSL